MRTTARLLTLVFAAASFSSPAPAAPVGETWFQITELARHSSTLVYDSARDRLIACGGRNMDATYNDLRAFDLSGGAGWTRLDGPESLLPMMVTPIVAYDASTDRLVFIYDMDTAPKVGAVSLTGDPVWMPITPSGTPPPHRASAASVYDPDANRIVLFGGERAGTTYFNDVWVLNLGSSPSWQQIVPDGVPPSPRRSLLAYDTSRHKIIALGLYGMSADPFQPPGPLTDVWQLTLDHDSDWVPLTTSGTFPSNFGAVAYDALHDRVLLLSTEDQGGSHALTLGATPTWTSVAGLPATLRSFGACLDPTRGRVLTFGGTLTYDTLVPDVWQFDLSSSQWSLVWAWPAVHRARKSGPAVYDPVNDVLVTFPLTGGTPLEVRTASMSTGEWQNFVMSPGPRPSAPVGLVAFYRPATDRVMIYGEFRHGSVTDEELWSFAYQLRQWTPITLSTPSKPPASRSIAYDPYRDRLIGYFGSFGVWVLPFTGSVGWVPLAASGTAPPQELGYVGVYDAANDRYVVTGRGPDFQPPQAGTWALTLFPSASWTQLTGTSNTPNGAASASVYDPLHSRILAANGASIHAFDGATWSLLDPIGAPPKPRQSNGAAYDPRRSGLIVVGGEEPIRLSLPIDDLWELIPESEMAPGIEPGADVVWSPGSLTPVHYIIRNPYPFAVDVPYRVEVDRNWPGYPLLGNVEVAANSTLDWVVDIPVPPSGPGEAATLAFSMIFQQTGFRAEDRRRLVDITTPTLLAVTSVEAEPGVVRLRWFGGGVSGEPVVERREAGSEWRSMGAPSVPSPGSYAFEDRDISAGREYVYRLLVSGAGATITSDESRVLVPARPEPGLWLVSGNPTRRLHVGFALPDAGSARLEVFDVSGRRQLSREVGGSGMREREEFLEAPALSPGVYIIRLTRGARAYTARAVLVR